MNNDNIVMAKTIGKVNVVTTIEPDYYSDSFFLDDLGKWSNYITPAHIGEFIFHRHTRKALDCFGKWRDEDGKYTSPPEWGNSREYEFVLITDRDFRYAVKDFKRFTDYENGYWCYLLIKTTVSVCDVKICSKSMDGYESDITKECKHQVIRENAIEAIKEARHKINDLVEWKARKGLSF